MVFNKVGESPSAWLCIENMCLAAFAEGLGSVITGFWEEYEEKVERTIGIPEGYELTGVVKVGVPAEEGSTPQKRPEFSWLHRNRF